jgi:hypothetical protein
MTALRLLLVVCSTACVTSLPAATSTDKIPNTNDVPSETSAYIRRGGSVLAAALDINHDGVLAAWEIAQAPVLLRALDLDRDGTLSAAELRIERMPRASRPTSAIAVSLARVRQGGAGSNLAFALDANHDGEIQAMEIANAVSSLKELDTDADGQISYREMHPVVSVVALAR